MTHPAVQIPSDWKEVLQQIQVMFPSAIIAGGALRDLWHNKPIKDVDIFIPVIDCDDDLFSAHIKSIDPQAIVIAASIYGQTATGDPTGLRYIHAVWQMLIKGTIYEVIFIQDRNSDILEDFDISICQIGYDGNSLKTTAAFNRSIFDKVLRVCNINRGDRQINRITRIHSKYTEYTIDPELASFEIPFL